MKILILTALVALFAATAVNGQDWKARLQASPSVEGITEYYSKFKKFGHPHQQLDVDGKKYFAYWIDGKDEQVQFFWLYQQVSNRWNLVVDHPQVASHFGSRIVWNMADGQFLLYGIMERAMKVSRLLVFRKSVCRLPANGV